MNKICWRVWTLKRNWWSISSISVSNVSIRYSSVFFTNKYPQDYTLGGEVPCAFKIPVRFSTVFTSVPENQLWEGVVGAKGSTKKRARGKRRVTRPKIDLHAGQRLGAGKACILWPGLNAPLIKREGVSEITKGDYDEAYFKRLNEIRNKSAVKKKRIKLPPVSRGWCGSRLGGQSIGPPAPGLPDFDTRVIEMKMVATMTASAGRYRRYSVVLATGNGNGLCGIGKAKALTMSAAVTRAKERAIKNVLSFHIKENRTLWHAGHVSEWKSKIFAFPAPEGSGIKCHRLIHTLCQVIGIKDMYAKIEGSTTNYQVIARGFLRLLSEQESYQDMANRAGLHVVEFSADHDMYPRVLASPVCGHTIDPTKLNVPSNSCVTSMVQNDNVVEPPILAISHPERHRPRKPKPEKHESFIDDLIEIGEGNAVETNFTELLVSGERDVDALSFGGRIPLIKRRKTPGYLNDPGNLKRNSERHRYRNHDVIRREREVRAALDNLRT